MDKFNNKPEKRNSYNEEGRRENRYAGNKRQTSYNPNRQASNNYGKRYTSGNTQREADKEEGERKRYLKRDTGRNTAFNRDNNQERGFRKNREDRDRNKVYGERSREFGERSREYSDRNREYGNRNNGKPENKFRKEREEKNDDRERKPFAPFRKREYTEQIDDQKKDELRTRHYSKKKQLVHRIKKAEKADAELRLNRYISMSGVCSRRDADVLITEGRVKVNDTVVQTVGMKVKRSDKVEVDGEIIVPERKVYLVLNKPKDYVTTVEDPLERKTVMSLIAEACKERVYPIGRLDRQTTGVLLFTNDGDLSKKLTHPKYEHKKIYHVFLDRPLEVKDLETISRGMELEDGPVKADEISYVSPDQTQVGIEIHSGRNRIVRRIFEHLGYQIEKLDRVYFAGITKKNLPRGKWRFLTAEEVRILKIY